MRNENDKSRSSNQTQWSVQLMDTTTGTVIQTGWTAPSRAAGASGVWSRVELGSGGGAPVSCTCLSGRVRRWARTDYNNITFPQEVSCETLFRHNTCTLANVCRDPKKSLDETCGEIIRDCERCCSLNENDLKLFQLQNVKIVLLFQVNSAFAE